MRNREILFIVRMRNEARKALRGLSTDLSKTAKRAKAASANMSKLGATAKKSGAAMKSAGAGATAFGAGMGRAQVAARGLLLAVAPLLGALGFVAAIKTIGDFEKQMQAVRAITGATSKEFLALEKEARRLGATTVFSATEAAGGLEFLARAGFTANEAITAVGATLNLAVVGNLGLAEAADIVSNVMQAFGIEVTKTAEATDILSFVAASTNTNIQQLGQAMKFAAPIANALGISMNDTAAAVGVLGNAGIQASLAGTGLRQTFLRLIDTTPKAEKALKTLGLTFADVDPRAKSLAEIFKTLKEAGLDASRAIQIFGIRTSGTALILTASADKIGTLADETRNVGGFASETARIMQDNLTDAFKQLVSALQEAIIATGKAGFARALRDTIDTITSAVRILSGFEGATDKATTAAKVLATVIKLLGVAFAVFVGVKVVLGIIGIAGALGKMVTVLKLATGAQVALNIAMFANPIGIVIAAVAALGAGLFFLTRNTKELTKGQMELAISTAELKVIQESTAASTQVGIEKQIVALKKIESLRKTQVEAAKKRAIELRRVADVGDGGGLLSSLFGDTDEEAARRAESAFRRLRDQLATARFQMQLLNLQLKEGTTDLSKSAKAASELELALRKVGIVGADFQVKLDRILDANVKGRAATEKNVATITTLNKVLKLSDEFLEAQGTTRAEVLQALNRLTQAEKDNLTVVESTIRSLKEEAFLADKSIDQKKVEVAVIKARTAALKLGEEFGLVQEERIRKQAVITAAAIRAGKDKLKTDRALVASRKRAVKAEERFNLQLEQTIASIDLETSSIGKSVEAIARARIVQQQLNKARRAGIVDAGKLLEIERQVSEALDRQAAARLKARGDAIAGAKRGLRGFIDEARDLNKQFEDFTTRSLSNLTDAITEFANTGKFSFKSFADSAVADLQRIVSKALVADLAGVFGLSGGGGGGGGIGGFISGLFGGGGGGAFDFGAPFARGGVVGRDGRSGLLPAVAFANAQRFQRGGLVQRRGTDSVPILATPGEVVLTEEQASSLRRVLETRNVGGLTPSPGIRQPLGGVVDARGVSNEVTVVMNITTPDVGGFRRSQGQIGAEAAASINRSLRRNG